MLALAALAVALSACANAVDQAKQDAAQTVKRDIQKKVDQAKASARAAVRDAAGAAKSDPGPSKSITPDMTSPAYATSVNPLLAYSGQCTWFAWGRAYEKWGVRLPMTGNAGTWYADRRGAGLIHSAQPRADSIAVWQKGAYGHVAYVEAIEGNYLVINEANWVHPSFGQHGSGYTGKPTMVNISAMATRYGTFAGYVYVPRP